MMSSPIQTWIQEFKNKNLWLAGEAEGQVERLSSDSRGLLSESQTLKTVFFARKGVVADGHDYLQPLASRPQIVAFVVERVPEGFSPQVPVIQVRDSTLAMALAVKSFYGDPTSQSYCVAVTGTNGKTTTTFLIQALLKKMGKRPVRMGTIETEFEGYRVPALLTTPDFTEMQKVFGELRVKGADAFVFEASSHALDQRRLLGLELDAAMFTNLTPEHLDYHQTMESYFQAKKRLFSEVLDSSRKKEKIAILPWDGAYGSRLANELQALAVNVRTWGAQKEASPQHLKLETWKTSLEGSELSVSGIGLKQETFRSSLIGRYNIDNVMGMLCLGVALQIKPKDLQETLNELPPISGRLERVKVNGIKASVFVDYAHTPDALENVLSTLRPLTKGKLKVVFGCGGDRDRLKRPQMGGIAELYADELFVTSDNPRTEDPEFIISEIVKGIQKLKPVHIEVDRKRAIQMSLQNTSSEDVVIIAGKGHENYQILGTTRIPFDDRMVVQEAAQKMVS